MTPFRFAFASIVLILAVPAGAGEHLTIKRDGARVHLSGKVVTEAQDGGVLLLAADGQLWLVQPEEIERRLSDEDPFVPLTAEEIGQAMLKELPGDFEVHTTAHYVICHNTSSEYAQWTGALFERLYRAFSNYWDRQGFEIAEPELPLVAIVFADRAGYRRYATGEIGQAADSIIGYYSLLTNRVLMYDLTDESRAGGDRGGADITRLLSRPEAGALVSTVIHEATHQLAFNCGLQTRLADTPNWLSEGLAMYFETPDLKSSRGWRGMGTVNRSRLITFRKYLRRRPDDSLTTLLESNKRLQTPATIGNSYAESWALVYYLIKFESKQFNKYLQMQTDKQPSVDVPPEQRLEEFEEYFGPVEEFDKKFLRQMGRVR